jgi:uncharacterized protein (DUF3084 family)
MNNTDLMMLLRRINQNNLQRKCLFAMGGIIIAASVSIFFLSNKNNKTRIALRSANELNNSLTIKSKELQTDLQQKQSHIEELVNENQVLQELISTKQNQNPS